MAGPMEFSDTNFQEEVLNSDELVMVDFWATWCGPCRIIAPYVEELSHEYEGKAKIGKLNIDQNSGVAAQYGVRSIPQLLFFRGGQMVDRLVGAVPKGQIVGRLDALAEAQ